MGSIVDDLEYLTFGGVHSYGSGGILHITALTIFNIQIHTDISYYHIHIQIHKHWVWLPRGAASIGKH